MDSKKKKELELWAARIRKTALQTIQTAGSGHIGGSFSICDILSVLYFDKMNVDPDNQNKIVTEWCSQKDTVHRLCMQHWH